MAARLNNRHQQMVRDKIQASQLVNRLQDHIDGKAEMSQTQLRAAEILLKKSVPDLRSVEVSGPDGAAIPLSGVVRLVRASDTDS